MSNVIKTDTILPSFALKSFVKQLISQYGVLDRDCDLVYLWTRELDLIDQNILLSHACPADEYEYYCSSYERKQAGLAEYDDLIQSWLDAVCAEMQQERIKRDYDIKPLDISDNPWVSNW